jgi:hypothetical protein
VFDGIDGLAIECPPPVPGWLISADHVFPPLGVMAERVSARRADSVSAASLSRSRRAVVAKNPAVSRL